MAPELREQIRTVPAELVLANGRVHRVDVFIPPGQQMADVLDASAYVATMCAKEFRLFSRRAIACLALVREDEVGKEPPARRRVRIRLKSGASVEGWVRRAPNRCNRTAADTLRLISGRRIYYVNQRHVESIERVGES